MSLSEISQSVLQFLGAFVVTGGGLVGISYLIVKTLGMKWINYRFDQSLEQFKHSHQQELERLRFQINAQFDRVTNLHKQEFDVLPTAWAALTEAYFRARNFISRLQSYPDLEGLSESALKEFLAVSRLAEWQKAEIEKIKISERNKYYVEKIFWADLDRALESSKASALILAQKGIFIEKTLLKELKMFDDIIYKAIIEKRANKETDIIPHKTVDMDALAQQGDERLAELETKVHSRLWASEI